MTKTKVITWRSPRGRTINLTKRQESMLRETGVWPKDPMDGQEYCQVSHGRHYGTRTFTDEQLRAFIISGGDSITI